MTPVQRIIAVLNARGIEATPEHVSVWIEKIDRRFRDKYGHSLPPGAVADAIEDGHKTWTMCLHLEFGDALNA